MISLLLARIVLFSPWIDALGSAAVLYRFEDYSLDVDRRELRRGGDLVTVEPLVFDLLEFLVRNSRKIVSKDDLIARVWNRRAVSDSTLSSRMTAVRHALGDSGMEQRLIRTIGRRGYRFIGPVACEEDLDQQPPHPLDHDDALSAPCAATSSSASRPAIAVLPFVNANQNPALDGFINGIVEDITTALAQFRWLAVAARSSSFAYSGWTGRCGLRLPHPSRRTRQVMLAGIEFKRPAEMALGCIVFTPHGTDLAEQPVAAALLRVEVDRREAIANAASNTAGDAAA